MFTQCRRIFARWCPRDAGAGFKPWEGSVALWHSSHHNLLLSLCWAGESAVVFPSAAFDYWSLTPHFLTAASKTNTGLGAHTALPRSLHAAQAAPSLHFLHGWRPPSCPSEDLVVLMVAQEPPALLGPQSWDLVVPQSRKPLFTDGQLCTPFPCSANPPVPLSVALLCPKDSQGKEGLGWALLAQTREFLGSPAPSPEVQEHPLGAPNERGLSQPRDTSPQPRFQLTGVTPRPAQGLPRQPRAPPRAGEEQLILLHPTQERCHQTPALFLFPLGACSS